MSGHEEALELAVKKAVIVFNETLAKHGSDLANVQMGHQYLAMSDAISTYTAKVGGEHGELVERLRGKKMELAGAGRTGNEAAAAIEALTAKVSDHENDLIKYRAAVTAEFYDYEKRAEAAEAALRGIVECWELPLGNFDSRMRPHIDVARTALSANSPGNEDGK